MFRLFLNGKHPVFRIELQNAEALRVVDVVAEYRCNTVLRTFLRIGKKPAKTASVKDIIP